MCSLYVPLVFLTSIDPPAFRPCWCMNRMKAALKEPVGDIMSLQTLIQLPFILLLRPLQASLSLEFFNCTFFFFYQGLPCEWSNRPHSVHLVTQVGYKTRQESQELVENLVLICSFGGTIPVVKIQHCSTERLRAYWGWSQIYFSVVSYLKKKRIIYPLVGYHLTCFCVCSKV